MRGLILMDFVLYIKATIKYIILFIQSFLSSHIFIDQIWQGSALFSSFIMHILFLNHNFVYNNFVAKVTWNVGSLFSVIFMKLLVILFPAGIYLFKVKTPD